MRPTGNDGKRHHIQCVLSNSLESEGRGLADGGDKRAIEAELGLEEEEETEELP